MAGDAFNVGAVFDGAADFVVFDSATVDFAAFAAGFAPTASLTGLFAAILVGVAGFAEGLVVGARADFVLAATGFCFSFGLVALALFPFVFAVTDAFFSGVGFALLAVFFFFVDKGATPEAEIGGAGGRTSFGEPEPLGR